MTFTFHRRHQLPAGIVADRIVVFGSSTLVFTADAEVYELSADSDTARRVDLVGRSCRLGTPPNVDPSTGELHVVAVAVDGSQSHIVISSGALTRRSYPLDAPGRVRDLIITRDHVLFVTDGCVGVTGRDEPGRVAWIETDLRSHPQPNHH